MHSRAPTLAWLNCSALLPCLYTVDLHTVQLSGAGE